MQRHVGKTPKGGVLPPRHGDQAGAERFQRGQDSVQLRRFTGIGDGNDDVVFAEAPQISVGSFHGMEKEGRRTGRGKGGGKLAADQAGFADAGHDHTPGARRQKPQRKDEGGFFRRPGVEPVPHGGEPGDFGIQNVLRELDERGGSGMGTYGLCHGKTSLKRHGVPPLQEKKRANRKHRKRMARRQAGGGRPSLMRRTIFLSLLTI